MCHSCRASKTCGRRSGAVSRSASQRCDRLGDFWSCTEGGAKVAASEGDRADLCARSFGKLPRESKTHSRETAFVGCALRVCLCESRVTTHCHSWCCTTLYVRPAQEYQRRYGFEKTSNSEQSRRLVHGCAGAYSTFHCALRPPPGLFAAILIAKRNRSSLFPSHYPIHLFNNIKTHTP